MAPLSFTEKKLNETQVKKSGFPILQEKLWDTDFLA